MDIAIQLLTEEKTPTELPEHHWDINIQDSCNDHTCD